MAAEELQAALADFGLGAGEDVEDPVGEDLELLEEVSDSTCEAHDGACGAIESLESETGTAPGS